MPLLTREISGATVFAPGHGGLEKCLQRIRQRNGPSFVCVARALMTPTALARTIDSGSIDISPAGSFRGEVNSFL